MGKERHRTPSSRGAKQPGRRPLGEQLLKGKPKKRSSGAKQESAVRVKKQRVAPHESSGSSNLDADDLSYSVSACTEQVLNARLVLVAVNRYSGATSRPGPVDRVSVKDLTPETFWSKYVSQRRPVCIPFSALTSSRWLLI